MTTKNRFALIGGTAWLGTDLVPTEDSAIVIEGRTITAAGSTGRVAIPDESRIVDLAGCTVLPGFIDCHVHIGLADPETVLRRGVTTVRDLAWSPAEIFALASRSRDPSFEGPLVLAAGPMLTAAGGYPITARWAPEGTGVAIESPQHAVAEVARLAREGATIIKVALNPPAGRVLPTDVLRAIVAAAHDHDLRTTAHVFGLDQLDRALAAGVNELAHMLMSPERIPDETIARMVAADMTVVPTLSIFSGSDFSIARDNLARFMSAGGRVVYGTDLGNYGPQPGIDPLEVTRMEEAGMSVLQLVRAATADAADYLGLPEKGTLEPGKDADIVCIDGSVASASDLTKVRRVFREGREA